ncbi:MAG: metal-dependent hydrolase [Myxococcaceae bacterium]|nr:metal-dependent hydrolase [Myxococcaceae bacterium]
MASLGHVALGMAAGRLWAPKGASARTLWKPMLAFSALSMLPDADVIGFRFGVEYGDEWGHRGASHALLFGLLLGLAAAGLARLAGSPFARTAAIASVTAMSHGVLDALTNGGLGAALLWPFSQERFFFPVHPIPVAPIGLGMLSQRGLLVLAVELILFSPFLLYATFPRRR